MSSTQRTDTKEDNLNDSWVELHFQQQLSQQSQNSSGTSTPRPVSSHNGQMDSMLLEALKEASRQSSVNQSAASSRASPKSPHSPNTEWAADISTSKAPAFQTTDWIWDWSSRPEANPPSEWSRLKHPGRKHKLSVRNTRVMKSPLFSMDNLPTLLLTHACSFFLGAAAMFVFLKKYCGWAASVSSPTVD